MEGFITQASNFVWSPALVALCLLGGLWFSVRGRVPSAETDRRNDPASLPEESG